MLRLAFDFIITWRETRTRPNAYKFSGEYNFEPLSVIMKNDCNVDTKKMYSKVEDFLKDDDFIKYVLDDAPESAFHWDKLLKEHAELLKVFEEAKNVLLVSDEAMEVMTLSEERKLKHRIFTTLEINNMDY